MNLRTAVLVSTIRASTDAFRLAMLVSSALLVAGAATNAVGIRNPAREAHPDAGSTAG